MKELTIEEKAKRYDESLERMRDFLKEWEDCGAVGTAMEKAEAVFPELRESKDERIRKEITEFFKNYSENGTWKAIPDVTKWIAWLEKQGEQKSLDDVAKEITKNKENAISFLKSCGIMNANGELADEYKIEQCEQKSEEVDNLHNYLYGLQKPADKVEPIVVRDFNSVFSREQIEEIDKRIEESQRLYNAKLRDAMRKVEDFPMTD